MCLRSLCSRSPRVPIRPDSRLRSICRNPVAGTGIRYTLDESIPTAGSPLYSGPIEVDGEVVITARAFVPGLLPSTPTSEYYIILGSDVLSFNSTVPIVVCSMLGRQLPAASPSTCGQGPYTPGRLLIMGQEAGFNRLTDLPHFQHRVGYRKRGNPDFSCGREKVLLQRRNARLGRQGRRPDLLRLCLAFGLRHVGAL